MDEIRRGDRDTESAFQSVRRRTRLWPEGLNADVDTSALIAFLDRSDSHHALFRRLFSEPPGLVTLALVAAEGHGWFLRRYDPHRAAQFLAFLDALPALHIVPFDPPALAEASLMVKKFADQKLTLVDAHGLAIMRKLRIPCCWSTHRHLVLGGATLVI